VYLGDSDAVRGYFFVSFLCLFLYFRVLEKLRVADLVGEISLRATFFALQGLRRQTCKYKIAVN
jgi:hypothetical protein